MRGRCKDTTENVVKLGEITDFGAKCTKIYFRGGNFAVKDVDDGIGDE